MPSRLARFLACAVTASTLAPLAIAATPPELLSAYSAKAGEKADVLAWLMTVKR